MAWHPVRDGIAQKDRGELNIAATGTPPNLNNSAEAALSNRTGIMVLQVSGKQIDIGEALRARAESRIREAVEKYFNGGFDGQVVLEREGSGYRSECTIHLDSGVVLHAEGTAHDAPASFDLAAERIEKRLRRYKRRRTDVRHGA